MDKNNNENGITTCANKQSYALGVLVVYQAFQLASRFATVDSDTAPKSPTAHTAIVASNFRNSH